MGFRKQFQKILTKQGIKFKLNTKVISAEKNNGKISVKTESAKGGSEESLDVDVVLVAVGRRPVTEGLNLDKIGVEVDNKGRIVVDDQFNTSVKGIKCIGDATFGPMLAHKAEEEGKCPSSPTLLTISFTHFPIPIPTVVPSSRVNTNILNHRYRCR